jgi:hypothetical protein
VRLILELAGWHVLDVEILLLRRPQGDNGAPEPVVTHTGLEDAQRSEPMDPDTIVFGFCVPDTEDD